MSTDFQKTNAKAIPSTRTVAVNEADHMPHDYSTTPGGTLFSTTPGGTRIIYDRKFLLECRSSPLARTPPRGLPTIPGCAFLWCRRCNSPKLGPIQKGLLLD
uniref:Eukaryotic translation initiation factor 4E binding protein 1 n=1 Tax=Nothobranchius furzeri TaxID=105023 RepID=A0A8C6PTW6_NOTFU